MRIATWNINSVRLRLKQVLKFIEEKNIDTLCLQETKTQDEFFTPAQIFSKMWWHLLLRLHKCDKEIKLSVQFRQ